MSKFYYFAFSLITGPSMIPINTLLFESSVIGRFISTSGLYVYPAVLHVASFSCVRPFCLSFDQPLNSAAA